MAACKSVVGTRTLEKACRERENVLVCVKKMMLTKTRHGGTHL